MCEVTLKCYNCDRFAQNARVGLLQRAHVALGWVVPRLALAAIGVVHVKVFKHDETDLGAVEYNLVVALERATSKGAAMAALVLHYALGA
eukprot:1178004-Pleurochrysis_carterae.AAC.2